VLLVMESMIRGGDITVTMTEDDGMSVITVRGTGNRVILQSEVRAALAGELSEEDLEPRAAPAYLAWAVATEAGGSTAVTETDEKNVELTAKLPVQNSQ
ncbi:histidine phosphotransferase family protein, partial [Kordiimonas sp.]|uniref:histidine phosphotransferase family protein n=1 Tax=Kordiimonas sp. TaxID=1970157 RepID=UPI003A9352E5